MPQQVDLENKLVTPDRIAELAIDDSELLQELLNGVGPQTQKSTRRENCSQSLIFMAETWPEVLLPHWDYFFQLFKCQNGFSKYVAIYVIASLTKADRTCRFKNNLDDYFALLDDRSVMVASHAALNAAKIAQACPALETEIVRRLLQVDHTQHDPGHLALLKAYVIDSLEVLFPASDLKTEIMQFVAAQINSESPKTRKLVNAFQKKWKI